MIGGNPPHKTIADDNLPAGTPPGSGEGSQSALAALIKNRKGRTHDEPVADPASTQAQQPQGSKKAGR